MKTTVGIMALIIAILGLGTFAQIDIAGAQSGGWCLDPVSKVWVDCTTPAAPQPQPVGAWCLDEVTRQWVTDGRANPSNRHLQCQNGQWVPFPNGTSGDMPTPPPSNH